MAGNVNFFGVHLWSKRSFLMKSRGVSMLENSLVSSPCYRVSREHWTLLSGAFLY